VKRKGIKQGAMVKACLILKTITLTGVGRGSGLGTKGKTPTASQWKSYNLIKVTIKGMHVAKDFDA